MSGRLAAFAFLLLLPCAAAWANAPKSDWVVGPINVKASGSAAYCSMKSSFQDGNSLVFARDIQGGNSLALDFSGQGLAAGGQYSVILDVGTLSRTLPAIAATEKVLIMQLGNDRPFFDMLRRKDILQISFSDRNGERSLGFGLSGTAEGLDSLEDCLEALRNGKPFTPSNALPAAATVKPSPVEKEGMSVAAQAMKKNMQDEVDRLKAENRRLMLENQQMERRMIVEQELLDEKEEPKQKPQPEIKKQAEKPKKKEAPKVAAKVETKVEAKVEAKPGHNPEQDFIKDLEYPELVAAPAPAPTPAPVPEVEKLPVAPVEKIVAKKKTQDSLLPDMLKVSGIPAHLSGTVNDFRSYAWNSDGVAGMAQERLLPQGQTISQAVAAYIDEARMKCAADFAHKLSPVERQGNIERMTGEIACIDDNLNAAAALVFAARGDLFVVSILEGGTEGMETALAKRDGIYAAIANGVK